MTPQFTGGINIAIKIPKSKYEATVAFYRDILRLGVQEKPITNPTVSRTHEVRFGDNIVWLDCVDNYTHSETWLELVTPDVQEATEYLKAGDHAQAVEHLRVALAHDSGYSAAWKLLGKALEAHGAAAEALEAYRSGIEVAGKKGDKQAAKEMAVFAKRLERLR